MHRKAIQNAALLTLVAAFAVQMAGAQTFLVTERNASRIWEWEAGGSATVFHTTQANDVDLNPAEGSSFGWVGEHFNDYFARFVPGSGSGLDQQYTLGQGGRTHYHYPKHITVYNGEIVVMSRNDATIWRYGENGAQLASTATGNRTGQGMATDGTDFFASFWNGSNSFFERYDASFTLQGTINLPTGMGQMTNIVDFAYDAGSGHFFGLATDFEGGTGTQTNTVLEFEMGGAVVGQFMLPFMADGIGQIPEPGTLALLTIGGLTLIRRRR